VKVPAKRQQAQRQVEKQEAKGNEAGGNDAKSVNLINSGRLAPDFRVTYCPPGWFLDLANATHARNDQHYEV